jgi:hypothetical protein
MTIRLMSIRLDPNEADELGTILLIDDESDNEDELFELTVRTANAYPGFVVVAADGRVMTDRSKPVLREAERLVRVLLIPASVVAEREKAVRNVLRTGYLNVLDDGDRWQTLLVRFVRGEITRDELEWLSKRMDRLLSGPAPAGFPKRDASIPTAWFDAANARIRRHLQDESVTVPLPMAANMLGATVDDVHDHAAQGRLQLMDVDDELRVPRWQFVPDTSDDAPGTYTLLPGLDVVIAAAPFQSQDAGSLTEWMTTPHPSLVEDGTPVSPRTWLVHHGSLATVVAAVGWHE